MSLLKNFRLMFSIKAMCRVMRVARSGWYAWRLRRHQIAPRQQSRLVCDNAVRKAFSDAKQRYGAPRLADELAEYNVKTIAASLRRQGLRAKASRRALMRVGFTWPWSLTCGREPSSAGRCPRG